MNVNELSSFIKFNWASAIAITIVITPIMWFLASTLFSERITVMEARIDSQNVQIEELNDKIFDMESELNVLKDYRRKSMKRIRREWSPSDLL